LQNWISAVSHATPEDYIAAQPPDRAEMLRRLRGVILANLPPGYVETINWGMISYEVPLSTVPKTYNGQPLSYAGLGNQKGHVGLYLCGLNLMPGTLGHFVDRLARPGRKLDMGKACIRLKRLEDINLDVVGEVIASTSVVQFAAAARR
jgi:Domain of unknown function (DU1801)